MPTLLDRYVGLAFVRWIAGIFLGCLAIVFLADFVETLRRAGDHPEAGLVSIVLITLYRLLFFGEQVLPFAVLFGSMGALLSLSRRLELVVARAVGMSVWRFLRPGLAVTAVVGIAAVLAYNPLAAAMKERADALEARVLEDSDDASESAWLRQRSEDGQSVIHAQHALEQGRVLRNVTVYTFDEEGNFQERVDARRAELREGYWELHDAVATSADADPEPHGRYQVDTAFTAEQVSEAIGSARGTSFWSLPGYIERARAAGLPALRYRLQYQSLLATPVLFLAMVLIAATVSLRLFRLGNVGWMILGGVVAGFVLYVVSRLAQDLGGGGLVHPIAAAWVPALVALLMGLTILLYQEDG